MASGKSGYILSTAGAVPVKNEQGKMTMEKVKVTRYVAGKRPDYAYSDDEDEGPEEDEEEERRRRRSRRRSPSPDTEEQAEGIKEEDARNDRRLRRIRDMQIKDEDEVPRGHRRAVAEPEILSAGGEDAEMESEAPAPSRRHRAPAESDEEDEEDLSDDEIDRRRAAIRRKAQARRAEEEALVKEEEEAEESEEAEEEESSEEDYSDSEDESVPRLKPVFVRKRDRVTLQESEKEAERLKQLALDQKRAAEERKRNSAKLVETLVKTEEQCAAKAKEDAAFVLDSVVTEDEDEEMAYEAWKLRELKRIKRDKDEKEAAAKERAEYERVHAMTEEERRAYVRDNPRIVTNKAEKGKYKFLQKYFHRGVFYLDQEEDVLKQNFAEATLEDKFDKSVLPKVMQVKDFGKAGRTKWTHLVQEDTTDFQSAWVSETAQNLKFYNKHAGGVKDVFERPAAKKKKVQSTL